MNRPDDHVILSQCVGRSKETSLCYGSYPLGDILVITRQYLISPLIYNEVNQLLKSLIDASTKVVHAHFELHGQSVHAKV